MTFCAGRGVNAQRAVRSSAQECAIALADGFGHRKRDLLEFPLWIRARFGVVQLCIRIAAVPVHRMMRLITTRAANREDVCQDAKVIRGLRHAVSKATRLGG